MDIIPTVIFEKFKLVKEIGVLPEGQIVLRCGRKYLVMRTSAYMSERLLSVLDDRKMPENDMLLTLLRLTEGKVIKCEIDRRYESNYTSTLQLKIGRLPQVRPSLSILISLLTGTHISVRRNFLISENQAKRLLGTSNFESIKMYDIQSIDYTFSLKEGMEHIDKRGYFHINFSSASMSTEHGPIVVEYTDGQNYYNFGLPPSIFIQKEVAKKLLASGNVSILRGRDPEKFKQFLERVGKYSDEFTVILEILKRHNVKITDAYFKLKGISLTIGTYLVRPDDAVLKINKNKKSFYLDSEADYAFILTLPLPKINVFYQKDGGLEGYA